MRNVRFADEQNGSATSSTSSSAASTSGGSGSSGPSSIESVQRNSNNSGLYDKTLVVIEKSNKELEKNLTLAASEVNVTSLQQPQQQPQTQVGIFWKNISQSSQIFSHERNCNSKKLSNILFGSLNTQFYKSGIFCLFTVSVFFPDKSFKLISKYTPKCQYNSLY